MEAMACGVPVIGSASGEIPHVIGDAGLVVPEGDHVALRDAVARVLTDATLRRDLAAKGRQRVLECFTHERIAEQTLATYRAAMV
jgi:glycosyltransferase involved in cell wall biosynthesis